VKKHLVAITNVRAMSHYITKMVNATIRKLLMKSVQHLENALPASRKTWNAGTVFANANLATRRTPLKTDVDHEKKVLPALQVR
jgi:hypothetical protein